MDFLSSQNLADEHIESLVRDAEAARLARVARSIVEVRPAVWRRTLGRGARGLSSALGAASARLDPSLDRGQGTERRPLRA